jgi:hypothetical protein
MTNQELTRICRTAFDCFLIAAGLILWLGLSSFNP